MLPRTIISTSKEGARQMSGDVRTIHAVNGRAATRHGLGLESTSCDLPRQSVCQFSWSPVEKRILSANPMNDYRHPRREIRMH